MHHPSERNFFFREIIDFDYMRGMMPEKNPCKINGFGIEEEPVDSKLLVLRG